MNHDLDHLYKRLELSWNVMKAFLADNNTIPMEVNGEKLHSTALMWNHSVENFILVLKIAPLSLEGFLSSIQQ